MARKQKNNASKTKNKEKQDIYVGEETIELNSETKNAEKGIVNEEVVTHVAESIKDDSEKVIENAIKEYNGEIKNENNEEKRIKVREKAEVSKIRKINKKSLVIISSIIFALAIILVAFAVINKMNSNVYKNIYLNEKELSGMTAAELTDYLKKEQEKLSKTSLKIFQDDEKILEIIPSDIDFEIDFAAIEEQVFEYGRESNIFKNNIDILYALLFQKEFDFAYKYDVAKLSDIVKEIKESIDNKVIDDSYILYENENKLIITRWK